MNTKSSRALAVAQMVLAGIVILLSTVAMSSNQTAPTPTASITYTSTLVPTATFTAMPTSTPTFTPSPIPTPAYPSASEIRKTLQSDFDQINSRLDGISKKVESPDVTNIIDNLVSNGIWAGLVTLLSVLGITRIIIKIAFGKRGEDKAISYDDLAKALSSGFSFIMIMLAAYFLIPLLFFAGQLVLQSIDRMELASISQKLDHIEGQLSVQPLATPTPYQTLNNPPNPPTNDIPDLKLPLVVSIGLLVLFLGVAIIISRNQTRIYNIEFSDIDWQQMGKKLLPAFFLVLIFYLLPYPIDTFLLPIFIPFLLFAFFEVVALLPNQHLKKLVVKHYSIIIFVAVFGVWYNVFTAITQYTSSIWNVIVPSLGQIIVETMRNQQNSIFPTSLPSSVYPADLVRLVWSLLLIIFAIGFAIPPWRGIRKISREKYISKISKSAESKVDTGKPG